MAIAPMVIGGGMLLASELLKNQGDAGAGYLRQGLGNLQSIVAPTKEELEYNLEQLQLQGILTPEMADAIRQDPSLMSQITSGQGMTAQLEALSGLQDIAREGGMTMQDKAKLNQIMGQIGSQARGAREAVMQRAAERGVAGGGMELVNQLLAEQAAATQGSQQGLDIAAQSENARLTALQGMANVGGGIESQQFGEAAKKAEAQDAINRFNVQNQQAVQLQNIAARNAAQAANLGERQRIADTNVEIRNKKAMADAAARQQEYENALKKATYGSDLYKSMAEAAQKTAAGNQAFQGSLIGGAGTVMSKGEWNNPFARKKIIGEESAEPYNPGV